MIRLFLSKRPPPLPAVPLATVSLFFAHSPSSSEHFTFAFLAIWATLELLGSERLDVLAPPLLRPPCPIVSTLFNLARSLLAFRFLRVGRPAPRSSPAWYHLVAFSYSRIKFAPLSIYKMYPISGNTQIQTLLSCNTQHR